MKPRRKFCSLIAVLLILLLSEMALFAGGEQEEEFPSKPVTFLLPVGAGGATDTSARILAEGFKKVLGVPIVVENKPGGASMIGLNELLTRPADGYTVSMIPTTQGARPYFWDQEPLDLDQFSYIGIYADFPSVIIAQAKYATWQEFIDGAKKNPGKLIFGTAGGEGFGAMKYIALQEGIDLKWVRFDSGGDISAAMIGGHIDLTMQAVVAASYQAALDGKLSVIAHHGTVPPAEYPDVPSFKELGYKYSFPITFGIVARKGIPEERRMKLEQALKKVLEDPEIIEKMENTKMVPLFIDGAETEKIYKQLQVDGKELADYLKAKNALQLE
jgi:tripartite-type tricarboxylate transporter receptor subunit TctC